MNRNDFKYWLINTKQLSENSANTRVSYCVRIDNEYDLDSEYNYDKCTDLLKLFEYSKSSFNNGEMPLHNLLICGNYYTNTQSLKQALLLYIEYKSASNKNKRKYSAIFIGDYIGFKHFFNDHCRNIISVITRSEKAKQKGICEYCGKKAVLQSAHRAGQERIVMIKNILDTYFKVSSNEYKVDLAEFDKYFKQAHQPYKDHFYYLCEDCHSKYENKIISQDQITKIIGR